MTARHGIHSTNGAAVLASDDASAGGTSPGDAKGAVEGNVVAELVCAVIAATAEGWGQRDSLGVGETSGVPSRVNA